MSPTHNCFVILVGPCCENCMFTASTKLLLSVRLFARMRRFHYVLGSFCDSCCPTFVFPCSLCDADRMSVCRFVNSEPIFAGIRLGFRRNMLYLRRLRTGHEIPPRLYLISVVLYLFLAGHPTRYVMFVPRFLPRFPRSHH